MLRSKININIRKNFLIYFSLYISFVSTTSIAQNIDDLNKKELRDIYQKNLLLSDSLNKLNRELQKQIFDLKAINESFKTILNTKDLELQKQYSLISELTQSNVSLKNKVESNENQIKDLQNKISSLNDSISNLKSLRIFSNGIFNQKEIDYITSFLKNYLIDQFGDENTQINTTLEEGKQIIYFNEGELGYVPAIDFGINFNPAFSGDFNQDGRFELIFPVEITAGGTAAWQENYLFKVKKGEEYELIKLNFDCPCPANYDCGASVYPEIVKVQNGVISISTSCYKNSDAQCCPSSSTTKQYILKNDQLVLYR